MRKTVLRDLSIETKTVRNRHKVPEEHVMNATVVKVSTVVGLLVLIGLMAYGMAEWDFDAKWAVPIMIAAAVSLLLAVWEDFGDTVSNFIERIYDSVIGTIGIVLAIIVLAGVLAFMWPSMWAHVAGIAAPLIIGAIIIISMAILRDPPAKEVTVRFLWSMGVLLILATVVWYFYGGGDKAYRIEISYDGHYSYNPSPLASKNEGPVIKAGKYWYKIRGESWTDISNQDTYVDANGDHLNGNRGRVVIKVGGNPVRDKYSEVQWGNEGEFEISQDGEFTLVIQTTPTAGSSVVTPGVVSGGHYHVVIEKQKTTLKKWIGGTSETDERVVPKKVKEKVSHDLNQTDKGADELLWKIFWEGRKWYLYLGLIALVLIIAGIVASRLGSENAKKTTWIIAANLIVVALYLMGGLQILDGWQLGEETFGEKCGGHGVPLVAFVMILISIAIWIGDVGGVIGVVVFILLIWGWLANKDDAFKEVRSSRPAIHSSTITSTSKPVKPARPKPSFTMSGKTAKVILPASHAGWYCPPVLFNIGGKVNYEVTGEINFGVKYKVGPKGDLRRKDFAVLSSYDPVGAALIRVDGKVKPTGFNRTWRRKGEICFAVNDSTYGNNKGSFTFVVSGPGLKK